MPTWSFHLNGGVEAKTFNVQGDDYSNAVVCQVRHCGVNSQKKWYLEELLGWNSRHIKAQDNTGLGTSTVYLGN